MPPPLEVLSAERESMPKWLETRPCGPEDPAAAAGGFLNSRIAFYPGSGVVDGSVFETFSAAHAVHGMLHADLLQPGSRVADILVGRFQPQVLVHGYRALSATVWDVATTQALLGLGEDHPFDQAPALQGACWCVLERESHLTDQHGRLRIAFLHV